MHQKFARTVVCLGIGGLFACGGGDDVLDAVDGEDTTDIAHWSYEAGEHGPQRWGDLAAEFATCSSGEQQSPIDIPAAIAPGPLRALRFDYAPGPATLLDNGHTVQVDLTEGANVLSIADEAYELLQFHFHARSEHAVAGQHWPLEVHLVHRSSAGELAVLGVFFDTGAPHQALSPVFDHMATASADHTPLTQDLDPTVLLPPDTDGWTYSGSLTTPPCTEGVRWHVLSTPLEISPQQLESFTTHHELSRRPLMANTSTIASGN